MHWTIKCARFLLLLVPALGLAAPAFAQDRDPRLSDSQEAGSVIVFPKFIRGAVTVDGVATPQTEIELGVVCPAGATCPEHQSVKVRFHWVCPGSLAFLNFVCRETDFDVTLTVGEKAVFSADGLTYAGVTNKAVPAAECPRGYLIGWVVDTSDRAIKFDGLIGDAVLRESGTAVSAYTATPIQADPALANQALISLGSDGALVFDGGRGHYQAVTGAVRGDVKYIREVGTGGTFNDTFLTLLTLDVQSNRNNSPTFVDLVFYGGNPSTIGSENRLSTFVEFICWGEFQLDTNIDENLNQGFMGRKGVFVSDPAELANGRRVTLLGIVETLEGAAPESLNREYITALYNDSVPVWTAFVP